MTKYRALRSLKDTAPGRHTKKVRSGPFGQPACGKVGLICYGYLGYAAVMTATLIGFGDEDVEHLQAQ